jgi:hypothetical protein
VATVSITQVPEITRLAQPSLACFVAHPFGLTLGAVGDDSMHDAVLRRSWPRPPSRTPPAPSCRCRSGGRTTCVVASS